MIFAAPSSRLLGELFGLSTALLWTMSALSFEVASRRVGSVAVNLLRLLIAFGFLCLFGQLHRQRLMPTDADAHQWKWLLASGAVGFFIGDLCLFRAFVLLGARLSTLIMCLAPPIAALTGSVMLDEQIGRWSWLGMIVTLSGIVWVVSERTNGSDNGADLDVEELGAAISGRSSASLQGIVLAVLGAAGQGVGLVMTKIGMRAAPGDPQFDPFAATQIRALAGVVIFAAFVTAVGRWKDVMRALRRADAMLFMTFGAIAGPFLGVSLLNASVQRISTGVAQTLAALVPVMIIPVVVLAKKERVTWRAAFGALVAVAGVAILLLRPAQ